MQICYIITMFNEGILTFVPFSANVTYVFRTDVYVFNFDDSLRFWNMFRCVVPVIPFSRVSPDVFIM